MERKDLLRIADALELKESLEARQSILDSFGRLKADVPFSRRLNQYIEDWFDKYSHCFVFVDEDDFDEDDLEGTFKRHTERFLAENKIHIWKGSSSSTIFGSEQVNWKFRAWHDFIHLTEGFGYDFIGESIVAERQIAMLPESWLFEKELVRIEVVGQAQYLSYNGVFVEDQRRFTVDYLHYPLGAIRNKQ